MNKQVVVDIIKKIFTYYGYNVNSSEISDLLAEKDSEQIFIKFDPDANINNIRYFSKNVHRYGGNGILVSEMFDDKTRMLALDEGLTLWDRQVLESQIGRVVLADAIGEHGEKAQGIIFKLSKTEYEKTVRIPLRSVPINIGKSDAYSIAEAKVGGAKTQHLKFIPVWYYNYSVSTQKKFRSRTVDLSGRGAGYIHAITGENYFVKFKDVHDSVTVPTQNYEIKKPMVEKNDAGNKALSAIIREHAKEVRINEMIGDTIVFENKLFAPDPADINLSIELIHFPVWEIRGRHEAIEINGYDGQIVGIKVYNDSELF